MKESTKTNERAKADHRLIRHGLFAPVDDVPMSALTMGLSVGCGIAVAMVLSMVIGDLVAGTSLTTASSCLGCIVAGLGTGLLQQVLFNPRVLRTSPPYPARTALFGLCDLAVLAGSAWFGGWVPQDMPGAWATFVVAYLAILLALTLALGKGYRTQETRYAESLAAYRTAHAHDPSGR